ncbi:vanw family protein [Nordella sp. HKS 07]|uniref:VanW family protein n=1 Tax=Nordella sp. HKS 07 TaxID=2712222 RepID=UPI0013E1C1FD|nr:VanW family protein [Nordella sp. HKS 07]QIG50898.1 vanw family protein [Nordella sp. HKS 07]
MTDRALSQVPGYWDMALFEAKATAFRMKRKARDALGRSSVPRHGKGATLGAAPVLARISSPLWHHLEGEKDRALTLGKIHNLRRAIRHLDGVEVPAGALVSFWRQVGRTTRRRGFVPGRELREGCLIASVGGGLCQLSNALHEAALDAGFDVVERHAHSFVVPGSRAAFGRDATVFWNYVDLRFRSPRPFRIEAALRRGALEIVLRGPGAVVALKDGDLREDERSAANDCTSCGETDCRRHDPEQPLSRDDRGPKAWLVDACWPEFSILFAATAQAEDTLLLPQRLRESERHSWPRHVVTSESCATLVALRRALALRHAPRQGRSLQDMLLRYDEALARHYARRLSPLHEHLVISQNLLPHLWRLGELQGRSFDVLMVRHPMVELEAKLDAAKARYPMSPTLGDFRAPDEIVAAESAALAHARVLYTPHSGIAAGDPARTQRLDWIMPAPRRRIGRGGKSILFPASALARKGAYALREAVRGLDLDIVVTGRASEQEGDFWGKVRTRGLDGADWPSQIAAVVLPALVEHEPRALLKALSHGLPVIATPECGLGGAAGVLEVPSSDTEGLRQQLVPLLG